MVRLVTTPPTVLITGATSLVGGALAAGLIDTPLWPEVLILAEARDGLPAYDWVVDSLSRFVDNPSLLDRISPDQILEGDFADPGAFIEDTRLPSIERVVHCAGQGCHLGAATGTLMADVEGTLRFVHNLRQVARIERFLQVSTSLICGDEASGLVCEDDYPLIDGRPLVDCAQSVAQLERLLRASLPGFPLVFVRPSHIVGDTRFGCTTPCGMVAAFRIFDALGMVPAPENGRMDVVPLDYVALALRFLLIKPELKYSCYHISAGEESSCNWEEIAVAFAESEPVAAGADARVRTTYRTATLEEIEARKFEFDGLFGRCSKAFVMKAIRFYAALSSMDAVFDGSRLRDEGLPAPPRFADYLHLCRRTCEELSIAEQMMIEFG